VLDIGCGDASLLREAGARIDRYVGVERDPAQVAELAASFPAARFVARDLDHQPLDLDERFDCVVMAALIEHLFNQEYVMRQVAAHLAPGGAVYLTTPTVLGNDLVHRLGSRVGLFARSATEDHIVIYNRQRFRILAREVGLVLERHQLFQLGCNQLAVLRAG
jgi:SAM-dependent methyltransferase